LAKSYILDNSTTTACNSSTSHPWAWLDRLGMGLAMVCAVHCLLTPVLVVCLPIIATTFWTDSNFHIWMLLLVVPLTILSMFIGCGKHKNRSVITFFIFGILFLTSGIVYGFFHGHSCNDCHSFLSSGLFPHGWESFLTTIGGFSLVVAHILNFRLCRKSNCSHD
jgi:uncharacterized membrane protein HdeD (DUF308 family)